MAISYETPAPIRVAILHSLSGNLAISEKPVMEATLLAIEQLNEAGGLLGRKIEPIIVDGKSDPATFAREAERLIQQENVSVIFGCWSSACRKSVKPVVEKFNHLLFYPVQYEGLEQSSNIIYLGAAPNQQLIPAVSWALKNLGSNVYLIGSDYIFPHVANWLMKKQIQLLQGHIVGEQYVALGKSDFGVLVEEIRKLRPDVVLNTINGDSNVGFFKALQRAGISSATMPVLSFSIGEPELKQINLDLGGHYVAWDYFQSIDNDANHRFIAAFQQRFGHERRISDPMASAWSGVYIWAAAVKSAQTEETSVVKESVRHESLNSPLGIISIDHHSQHTWKIPRIGKIRSDGLIDEVWSHGKTVRPEPFPYIIERGEATSLLDRLYYVWGNQWKPDTSGSARP